MMMPKRLIQILSVLPFLLLPALPALAAGPAPKVDYLKQVQPLLRASCYQCHGPDSQAAGLRLDVRKDVLGHVVIPGKSASSLLLQRLTGQSGKPRMPMGFAPLPPDQVSLIRRWIDQGAVWPAQAVDATHWAYVKPVRPAVPAVKNTAWIRNPIDNFVLSRLEKEGLHPSPEAPRAVLLRRVYLDLTGLPPSVKDVDAFLADRSPGAYEKVVDRLLASPQYGERQAAPWLDLARYADTNGYEKDSRRTIWPYRDWVVNAFNKDMPYDEFTIEQIAGDMLPNATLDQKIATGFNRNTMYNDEGGVDRAEQTWLTQVDRVGTTASVWLGSTLACAECHDHKYDPFKQKEFYSFLAFFNNLDEPELAVPDAAQKGLTTLVMKERTPAIRATAYVRIKGSFLNKGDEVSAGVPVFLPPIPAGRPINRLGLAYWLADPNNPLVARVAVNRFWEEEFGRGIVETSEDFGTQGSPPSHPKLLDWLATEFIRQHWSMKAMHRLIVTSATYRQSSHVTPDLLEKDPYNRLLARGPRFRMEAEMIRDTALSAAGELSLKMGGPSVFPLQPDGIWSIPYSDDQWHTSPGVDRYRRGLYTFWRRTSPYPAFITFDAPSREYCTVRRIRTNTPLQALTTLNDEAFLDAARGMALRMVKEGGDNPRSRVQYGFRLCVARQPTPKELSRLMSLYAGELAHFRQDLPDAKKLAMAPAGTADIPDTAALTLVSNVLLNMDETLTKE